MVKKVLSVALALVMAMGVFAIAVSAYSAADLSAIVATLPDDENARFYNQTTAQALSSAKAAAAAALASGDSAAINDAYAQCKAAYDLAFETAEYETPDGDYWTYYVNRDESVATAHNGMTSDVKGMLRPGDEFTVTLSVQANFFVSNVYLGFAYDSTKLEVVDATQANDTSKAYYEFTGYTPYLGRAKTAPYALRNRTYYPTAWSDEMVNQYFIFEAALISNQDSNTGTGKILKPTEKTDILNVTMRVLDTAEDGEARIFMSNDFKAQFIPTDFDYEFPILKYTRGAGENLFDSYTAGDTTVKGFRPIDEQAEYDQTITFDEDLVVVIGQAVDPADYSKLDEAIASKDGYDESLYTEDSWAAFANAVSAGSACDRELSADDQDIVDNLTKDIVDARNALVAKQADGCKIISVTAKNVIARGSKVTLDVKVEGNPAKLRFVDEAANTITITRDHAFVSGIVDNGDGTETWTLSINVLYNYQLYKVYAKYAGTGWSEPGYNFILKENPGTGKEVYSAEVVGAVDGRIHSGFNTVKVVTGTDVIKVQLERDGATQTYSAFNASFEDVNGQRIWTINAKFGPYGLLEYNINVRTNHTAFETSDKTLRYDVLING